MFCSVSIISFSWVWWIAFNIFCVFAGWWTICQWPTKVKFAEFQKPVKNPLGEVFIETKWCNMGLILAMWSCTVGKLTKLCLKIGEILLGASICVIAIKFSTIQLITVCSTPVSAKGFYYHLEIWTLTDFIASKSPSGGWRSHRILIWCGFCFRSRHWVIQNGNLISMITGGGTFLNGLMDDQDIRF